LVKLISQPEVSWVISQPG